MKSTELLRADYLIPRVRLGCSCTHASVRASQSMKLATSGSVRARAIRHPPEGETRMNCSGASSTAGGNAAR